ncbi:hypothetical protein [Paracoccus amoyensis]|uniref:hypothetical protein n=1 Tax=Paracoccus amoyensis TaxID=2760093 RepID=UPI001FE358E3|nr:hypothetical protein [Paracoccus amoyensis]
MNGDRQDQTHRHPDPDLTRASARPGNLALRLPNGLHGAAAKMAIARMIKLGFIDEVEANIRRGEPLWRETGDG